MPPELDIYGITQYRDKATISQFFDKYVDRFASENRGDEELMLLPLTTSKEHLAVNGYEWEPAYTLTHIVERGLQYPRRAFTVYLLPKDKEFDRIILSFTLDNQLIVGLAIDDEGMQQENIQRARILLDGLMEDFKCHAGLVVCENPPPVSESEFLSQSSTPLTEFYKTSGSFHKKNT
jgi:hypothetical protein